MIGSVVDIHPVSTSPTRPHRDRARRSSKLRWPGWIFIVTTLFLAIGAFNGQNNLLFFTFGLSVSAILLSGMISGAALLGLRVRRQPLRAVAVGSSGSIRYEITNHNRVLPVFGVLIEEVLETDDLSAPGKAQLSPGLVASARAGETVRTLGRVRGVQTGVVRLRGLRIRSSLPFGLIEKRIDYARPGELEVHPPMIPVRRPRGRHNGRLRSPVAVSTNQVGGDEEFLGVREFVSGDSTRKIAWARSAAHDSLVVKTNARPRPETFWISVGPVGGSERDLQLVQAAVASYAADRIAQGVAVGLDVDEWGVLIKPRGGRDQLQRILSALSRRSGGRMPENGSPPGERLVIGAGRRVGPGERIDATDTASWVNGRATLPPELLGPIRTPSRWSRLRLRLRDPEPPVPGTLRGVDGGGATP